MASSRLRKLVNKHGSALHHGILEEFEALAHTYSALAHELRGLSLIGLEQDYRNQCEARERQVVGLLAEENELLLRRVRLSEQAIEAVKSQLALLDQLEDCQERPSEATTASRKE